MVKLYGRDSCLPLLVSCCCGLNLQTGCKIIGLVVMQVGIISIYKGSRTVWNIISGETPISTVGEFIIAAMYMEEIILMALFVFAAGILLEAIHQNHPTGLEFFIVVMFASVIQSLFHIFLSVYIKDIGHLSSVKAFGIGEPFGYQIALIFNSLLTLYFTSVVNSHYIVMKEQLSSA